MFNDLEKIWIEEIFNEKYHQLLEKQNDYYNSNSSFSEALTNDLKSIETAFNKIKELF